MENIFLKIVFLKNSVPEMKILYTKHFSKYLDKITNDVGLKKNLLQLIDRIKQADYLSALGNLRKIKGYEGL